MNYKQAFALGLCSVGSYEPTEEWETLFDGAVTTVSGSLNGASASQFWTPALGTINEGEPVRLSVNGATTTATWKAAESNAEGVLYAVGNEWLAHNPGREYPVDNGGDYALVNLVGGIVFEQVRFCSRAPGTYTVKIERKV